jgi:hypothetical protein
MGNVYKKEAAAYRRRQSGDADSLPPPLSASDVENVDPSSALTPPSAPVAAPATAAADSSSSLGEEASSLPAPLPGSGRVLRSAGRSAGKGGKGPSSHGKRSAKKQAGKQASIFGDISDLFSCVSDTNVNRGADSGKKRAAKKPLFSCAGEQHGTPNRGVNSPADLLDMIQTPDKMM